MKTIIAAGLVVALAITGLSLWGAVYAQRMAVSSSQIYIDGTPVCVLQQDREIIASVGICGTAREDSREDGSGYGRSYHRGMRSPHEPRPVLPPGHPPVDSIPAWDEGRRILI